MKKIALILLLLAGVTAESRAQSWADLLKSFFSRSSSATKEVVEESKYISASELAATWVFENPVIDYTGTDPVATMAVSALEGQMESIIAKGGVVSGRDYLTLKADKSLLVGIDKHLAQGRYSYNPKTGEITLQLSYADKQATLTGNVEWDSGVLTLRFNANEALRAMTAAVPSLTENEYVQVASTVIANYPGIRIGGTFKKR